ncbi:MAG: superoxide dismutase family protein [Dehalococcoidia bacterium]|nr:superoxide dismutase family protein [Dehalococcoidia bacterium]
MKKLFILLVVAAMVALGSGVYFQNDGAEPSAAQADAGDGRVLLRNASGEPVGVAKLTQEDGEVLVRVTAHDLPAGFHGFHVHAVGICTAPFASAGGHFNPAAQGHPGHAGDMPVLLMNADGTGEARFKTDRYDVADLFDADGSALIIHADPDNYANIPARYLDPPPALSAVDAATLNTGDAGGRLACGVVEGG